MALDENLVARVRSVVGDDPAVTEKSMFSGHSFLVAGNIACGVHEDNLFVRTGPKNYEEAMQRTGVSVFDLTGKTLKGWIVVDGEAVADDAALERWVGIGVDFARTLPAK